MTPDIELVRCALGKVVESASSRGMPQISLSGQLIRPSLAYAAACSESSVSPEFWSGALAIQYAHEASLVHDDVVDEAKTRRGEATVVETSGIARALVLGDHLLTASYRLAAETGSMEFMSLFSQCVERTVAGEIAQAKSLGKMLSFDEYRVIAESKSGELLAASLALSAAISDSRLAAQRAQLGRELGLLYQMLDDLLDYCPATDAGKPALGDFAQKRWTWPLSEIGEFSFDESHQNIQSRLRQRCIGTTPFERCTLRLERHALSLKEKLSREFHGEDVGQSLIDSWISRAQQAVQLELRRSSTSALRSKISVSTDVVSYLSRNSKSFRFASRFFPQAELDSVAHVYAFCRVTDDIVDDNPPDNARPLLDEWMVLAHGAYHGIRSGIPFLDRVMMQMSGGGISFTYAEDLADGMRMDLRGEEYATLDDLRIYTYRVASVVGLWLTKLAGVHDIKALSHAAALGHAMQLTNILRDVGEDARRGRVYLPTSRLAAYGVERESLKRAANGQTSVPCGFSDLIEDLLNIAERDYSYALDGVQYLPHSFQKPVAVAAHVYRGIHSEIRRNRYDTLTRRAITSARTKAMLAARAVWQLQLAQPPILRSA